MKKDWTGTIVITPVVLGVMFYFMGVKSAAILFGIYLSSSIALIFMAAADSIQESLKEIKGILHEIEYYGKLSESDKEKMNR